MKLFELPEIVMLSGKKIDPEMSMEVNLGDNSCNNGGGDKNTCSGGGGGGNACGGGSGEEYRDV